MKSKRYLSFGLILIMIFMLNVNLYANSNTQNNTKRNLSDTRIDLMMTDMSLRDAFRALGDVAGLNVITGEGVRGYATFNLRDMDLSNAIDLLAKAYGLDYKMVNNTLIVDEPERLRISFENVVTKIYRLSSADADEVSRNLMEVVGGEGVQVNRRMNSVIVTTFERLIPDVEKIITSLDKEKMQVAIEVRFEEVSKSYLRSLGVDLRVGQFHFDPRILLKDKVETEGLSLFGDGDDPFIPDESEDDGNFMDGDGDYDIDAGIMFNDQMGADLQVVLNALADNGNSTTLANPQLATVDGESANVMIGDRIPLPVGSGDEKDSSYIDVGIKLDILPRIVSRNEIFIDVQPEVSTVSGYIDQKPIISTRKVSTKIRVENEKTIAIAGLLTRQEMENMTEIPILGGLPLIGRMFQNKKVDMQERELIIFITPTIIGIDGEHNSFKDNSLETKEFELREKERELTIKSERLEEQIELKTEELIKMAKNNESKTRTQKEQLQNVYQLLLDKQNEVNNSLKEVQNKQLEVNEEKENSKMTDEYREELSEQKRDLLNIENQQKQREQSFTAREREILERQKETLEKEEQINNAIKRLERLGISFEEEKKEEKPKEKPEEENKTDEQTDDWLDSILLN